jgi:uncharacterized ubiquitin-like protein YukD
MDTVYFDITLESYRARTRDPRRPDELPLRVLSQLLQDAQSLKQAALMDSWIKRRAQ